MKSQFKIDKDRAKSKDEDDDNMVVFDSAIDMEAYLSQHSHYLSTGYSHLHNCSLDCPSERRYHKCAKST